MFRIGEYQFIFSTTVLERGITIRDVSVIILDYLNVFDEANLIQMLGRIGRGIEDSTGAAYIICQKKDRRIKDTISYIERANSYL